MPRADPASTQTLSPPSRWSRFAHVALIASSTGASLWSLETLYLLPCLVLMWRQANSAGVAILGAIIFAAAALPDLPSGIANFAQVDAWAGCAAVLLWTLASYWGLGFRYRRSGTLTHRIGASLMAWVVAPATVFPIVVWHPMMAIASALAVGLGGVIVGLAWCVWAGAARSATPPMVAYGWVLAYALIGSTPEPVSAIVGVHPRIGPALSGAAREKQVEALAAATNAAAGYADVVLLPELVLDPIDGSSQRFARDVDHRQTWAGIAVRRPDGRWSNAIMRVGYADMVSALLPLPVVNWQPWRSDGAAAFERPTTLFTTHGAVRVLFCYEAVSSAAWFAYLATESTQHVAWVANLWWSGDLTQRAMQTSALGFARASGAALTTAVNR